eukprot:530748_1
MTAALSAPTICKVCITAVLSFIYVVGIYQWRVHRYHFIIANRFPFISYFNVGLAFCIVSTTCIGNIICDITHGHATNDADHTWEDINAGCTFCLCSLSVSRSFIVYQRFKFMDAILKKRNNIAIQTTNHIVFRILIVYTVIGTSLLLLSTVLGAWTRSLIMAMMGILTLFIICTVIVMITTKLNEGIGCIKEVMFVLVGCLSLALLSGFRAQISSDILSDFTAVFISMFGLITLYLPLFYIHKIRKSIKPITMNKETVETLPDLPSNSDVSVDMVAAQDLNQPLYMFLKKKECYDVFREYLGHCFAVESLLFVESVVILCNLMMNVPNRNTQIDDDAKNNADGDNGRAMIQWILDIRFEYLFDENPSYAQYKEKIQSVSGVVWDKQRKVYLELYLNVFNAFLTTNSVYQVNVSGNAQERLARIFLNGNTDKLQSVNDFVGVFETVLLETFNLMRTVYAFNFKKYAQQRQ